MSPIPVAVAERISDSKSRVSDCPYCHKTHLHGTTTNGSVKIADCEKGGPYVIKF